MTTIRSKLELKSAESSFKSNLQWCAVSFLFGLNVAALSLPGHIDQLSTHREAEIKKQMQELRDLRNRQLEALAQLEALKLEYGEVINLAKKLGINIVFEGDKIVFHIDSKINIDYIITRLEQLGISYILVFKDSPNSGKIIIRSGGRSYWPRPIYGEEV